MRELEKFEIGVLDLCKDEKLKKKLRKKLENKSTAIDPFELKKIEEKIRKANQKMTQ